MEEKYKSFFEDDESLDDKFDKKVDSILKTLRDEDFTNEEQRKKFIDLLSSLHNSKDPRARKAFKHMGQLFTEIGTELINYGQE